METNSALEILILSVGISLSLAFTVSLFTMISLCLRVHVRWWRESSRRELYGKRSVSIGIAVLFVTAALGFYISCSVDTYKPPFVLTHERLLNQNTIPNIVSPGDTVVVRTSDPPYYRKIKNVPSEQNPWFDSIAVLETGRARETKGEWRTYRVTYVNGRETHRELLHTVPDISDFGAAPTVQVKVSSSPPPLTGELKVNYIDLDDRQYSATFFICDKTVAQQLKLALQHQDEWKQTLTALSDWLFYESDIMVGCLTLAFVLFLATEKVAKPSAAMEGVAQK